MQWQKLQFMAEYQKKIYFTRVNKMPPDFFTFNNSYRRSDKYKNLQGFENLEG